MSDLIDSLSRNLRGYWCPMLQYGGLVLRDHTRFKNNGTLTNMDTATDWIMSRVRGRSGRVLDFDGTNDLVIGSNNYSVAGQFAFSCWLNLSSSTGFRWIAGKTDFGQNKRSWHFYWSATNTRWELGVSETGGAASICLYAATDTITTGQWVQMGFSYNANLGAGERVRFYKNGSFLATTAITDASLIPFANDVPIAFSASRSNGTYSNYFAGQAAEYALWGSSLGESVFRSLYRLGPGWYQPQSPRRIPYSEQQAGFKAYWARQQSTIIGGGVR